MTPPPLQLTVARELDRQRCAQRALAFAREAGCGSVVASQFATSVSELAGNVLRHAGSGHVRLAVVAEPWPCVEAVVDDAGPGFTDITTALQDGYSEGRALTPDNQTWPYRGLGSGLSAVRRFMDFLSIENQPLGGARVVIRKRAA